MQIPGVHIETIHNPRRHTYAQIDGHARSQRLSRRHILLGLVTAASHLAGDVDEIDEHDQVQDPDDPQERRRDARADVAAVASGRGRRTEEGWAALPSIEEVEGRAR